MLIQKLKNSKEFRLIKRKPSNYLYLIEQFAITDFKMRYSRSLLGYLWSLVNPLMFFVVYYLVFSVLLQFGTSEYYPIYLLSGILLWNFFAEATLTGMKSLSYKSTLLTKVKLPAIIIPMGSLLASSLTILINLLVLMGFIVCVGLKITAATFYAFFLIGELMVLAYGVSLMLCSFYLKFRDLDYVWNILLQLGFWACPIVYQMDMIPDKFSAVILMNPMTRIIIYFQDAVIKGTVPGLKISILSFLVPLLVLVLGITLFQSQKHKFSEWV